MKPKSKNARGTGQLVREAIDNPYRLFTPTELPFIIKKSRTFILAAKKKGAPFPGGSTRPEWFNEWLRANPTFNVKSV